MLLAFVAQCMKVAGRTGNYGDAVSLDFDPNLRESFDLDPNLRESFGLDPNIRELPTQSKTFMQWSIMDVLDC